MAANNYPNNNDQNPFAPGQQTSPELSPYNAGYPVKPRLNQIRDVSLVEGNITLSGVTLQFPADLATEPTLQNAVTELQDIEAQLTTLNSEDFATEATLANLASISQDVLTLLQTGSIDVNLTSGITLDAGTINVDLTTLEGLTTDTNNKLDQLLALESQPVVVSGLGDIITAIEEPQNFLEESVSTTPIFVAQPITNQTRALVPANFSALLDATIQTAKAFAGNIYGINAINPNGQDVYLKIFDSATAVLGTTIPVMTLAIPDAGAIFFLNDFPFLHNATGIQVAVTANANAFDTTNVSPVIFNLFHI